ncbi:MAG TPA: MFS transporter [Polyangiaceae bacterium]|nr:MFS transporter [Polyangiaceae bacterium]
MAVERETGSPRPAGPVPFTAYQKRLFGFLSVACFFEGYDFFALSQLLPNLRVYFGLNEAQGSNMVGVIGIGTVLAYLIVGLADRWGRRRVLTTTILGYTLFTLFSGLAPNAIIFTICQLVARIFLIGEWATSMVIASEEYPAERRGLVIGVVSAAAGLGSIVCAGVVPLLLKTPLGWRAVYLVGVIPLLLAAVGRRGLRETERFQARSVATPGGQFAIWKTAHARRVLELGAIWFFCYICTQNAVTFWKEFAVHERSLTDAQVAKIIAISALVSMPLAFAAGHFLDAVGRKIGGTVILGLLSFGVALGYTATSTALLAAGMIAATIGVQATLTLLNTFTTELFPTEQRGAAFAWSNNLLGRIGYWLSPFVIGQLVKPLGWGPVLRATAVFPVVAIVLIWVLLPETKGRELESTAEVRS